MGNISFEDFKKLEIRVGKVLSAEKIEGADRLLRLEVDFGDEKRQIVSGIAEFYKVENLEGKEFIFLVNLEHRKFKGIESQGMILAADDDGNPVLLQPEKEVSVGSLVK
jgi:methionine--tRNA ligase beta chain